MIKEAPQDMIQPFMRIRQYVSSMILQSDGESLKLASSRELCNMFNVTRPTVQKALKKLIDDGELVVKPGMGTFVNPLRVKNINSHNRKILKICVIFSDSGVTHIRSYHWKLFHDMGCFLESNNAIIHILSLAYDGPRAAEEICMYNPDGVLWIMPSKKSKEVINILEEKKMPLVLVNPKFTDTDASYIRVDYELLGFLAGKYLIEKGHKQVLFVAKTEIPNGPMGLAYSGFEQAYKEAGKPDIQRIAISATEDINKEVYNYCKYGNDLTGIFTFDAFYATVCDAIIASGKRLDQFDIITQSTPSIKLYQYSPTIIKEPLDEVGRLAAKEILDKIKSGNKESIQKTLGVNI